MSYLEGRSPVSPLSSLFLPETTSPDRASRTGPRSPRNGAALGRRSACSPQRSAGNTQTQVRGGGYRTRFYSQTHMHAVLPSRPPLSPTLGRLVLLSMMKFQSFAFKLCATLYFLTNARLSVVAPPAVSPPRAPWVITPRTVFGTPRSTCRDCVWTKACGQQCTSCKNNTWRCLIAAALLLPLTGRLTTCGSHNLKVLLVAHKHDIATVKVTVNTCY